MFAAAKNWAKIVVGSTLIAATLFVSLPFVLPLAVTGVVTVVTAGIDLMDAN